MRELIFSESELKKLVFLVDLRHGGRRLSACTASRSSPNPASWSIPKSSKKKICKFIWREKIAWSRELIPALVMQPSRVWLHEVQPSIWSVVARRGERLHSLKFSCPRVTQTYIWRYVIFLPLTKFRHLCLDFLCRRSLFMSLLELNFAVNVAATYALTELMMPLLEKAAPDARVITVSSGGMYTTPLTPDLQFSESNFDGTLQYARNKRVQVALTEKWAETYTGKGIDFYSMHPGWADTPGVAQSLPGFSERLSGKLRTKDEGADTVIWLALQPKEKLKSGAFYFDRAEAPKHLLFAGTAHSHAAIHGIVDGLRSLCKLP
ncbi:uncharacterized protein LOC135596004 isoform X2 [Musa acuminata AAA Group]|uniref:uncharacterized protein LOC135596004 isoform X2 n=1 Tax=Musa acuminata AAA Group TaxID=214697 RepID=UPI0031DDBBB8